MQVCRDINPKRGNTIGIYISWGILGRGDHHTLAEDGDIKKIWGGYYSQMLN